MKAKDVEYVVFDVETTGLSPLSGDRVIEIGAVKIRSCGTAAPSRAVGFPFRETASLDSLINPQRSVPEGATRINKITEEMLLSAPTAEEALGAINDFIGGACLLGHNVKFDLDFLCYELALMGAKLRDENPVVDTLKMAKDLMPQLSNYRLESLANAFGIVVGETHRALADARLTAAVFQRLLPLAEARGIAAFADVHRRFGVEKPNFKITQPCQDMLF